MDIPEPTGKKLLNKKFIVQLFDVKNKYYIMHDICPLKLLPLKKVSSLVVDGETVNSAYVEGWNDCIDEILGKEK